MRHEITAVDRGSAAHRAGILPGDVLLRINGEDIIDEIDYQALIANRQLEMELERDGKPMFLEVKGVTLEEDGVCRFPDAPTQRGARHLRELILAKEQGYDAAVLFVIQMAPVRYLTPNDATDPEFGKALRKAAEHGVSVLAVDCHVTPDTMTIGNPVAVQL